MPTPIDLTILNTRKLQRFFHSLNDEHYAHMGTSRAIGIHDYKIIAPPATTHAAMVVPMVMALQPKEKTRGR